MIAILLCAGFATRMYPLTKDFPKPLLQVAGKPVLDYFMEQLLAFPGLREIQLVTNARFFAHFQRWQEGWLPELRNRGIQLVVHNDGATANENRLGAIADLALIVNQLNALEPAVVAAGDNIFRFPLVPIAQRFHAERKNFLLALHETDMAQRQRTGVLVLEEGTGRVRALLEKPQDPPTEWTCPALYFLQPEALQRVHAYLQEHDAHDAPGHFISYLVEQVPVHAVKVIGRRFDIGSLEELEAAEREVTEV